MPSSFPYSHHRLSPPVVCAVHTNISCHIPHEHYCHTCCVTLPVLMATAGFSDIRCHVHHLHTQSVSHTHCLCHHPHSHTGLVIHLQESLHPIHLKDSDTHRTSSLSTIPRNQGCHRHLHTHTHTHRAHHPSHQSHGHIRQSSCLLQIYTQCLSLTSSVSHRLWPSPPPPPKHSLLPMLWGLQPGCQSKIPHLQFHVFSDKKIS